MTAEEASRHYHISVDKISTRQVNKVERNLSTWQVWAHAHKLVLCTKACADGGNDEIL